MSSVVVEMECLAAVQMDSGNQLSLLKNPWAETITPSLRASRGKLERGKFYEVTFREIGSYAAEPPLPQHQEEA